ncbi:hypothetical protein [Streptomyces sp. 8L]|uniref:hypothetical protein n=1 Tax=Streptomyces sp. 8L TaxID=2877242 RepID=UPI001CD670A7|nr:hypothetical protein [Streptomyces sp. 8L]MCA1217389.1 hypothetical protein [Streptomyces sp. 8L]
MTTTSPSILRQAHRQSYTRYTSTNGMRPEGGEYGVDGWLFTLPGETINGQRFPQRTYAAFEVPEHGMLFWMVREVDGKRRQRGSRSTSRRGAVAYALSAVAAERERAADSTTADRPGAPPIATERAAEQSHVHSDAAEAEHLERVRRSEEDERPVKAEIRLAYPLAGGGASLCLYDARGNEVDQEPLTERGAAGRENNPNGFYLGSLTSGAMTAGLLRAAGWHLKQCGFQLAPDEQWTAHCVSESEAEQWAAWAPMLPDGHAATPLARATIVPTREHLAVTERRFGPLPEIPPVVGLEFKQMGRWSWCSTNSTRLLVLTWTPQLGGDRWNVWDETDRPRIVGTARGNGPSGAADALTAAGLSLA